MRTAGRKRGEKQGRSARSRVNLLKKLRVQTRRGRGLKRQCVNAGILMTEGCLVRLWLA